MKKFLNSADIFLNLKSVSKFDAIKLAGEKLVNNGYVNVKYIDTMIEREKISTTYLGMGFAIPHGTNESKNEIINSGIVILQFPDGIDFDGETAYILIAIAGKNDEHLEILSHISIILDEDLNNKLRKETNIQVFIDIFSK